MILIKEFISNLIFMIKSAIQIIRNSKCEVVCESDILKELEKSTNLILQNKEHEAMKKEIEYIKNKFIYIMDVLNEKIKNKLSLLTIYSNWSSLLYFLNYFEEGTEILKMTIHYLNYENNFENLEYFLLLGIVSSNLVIFYLKKKDFKKSFYYAYSFNKKMRAFFKINNECEIFNHKNLMYLFLKSFLVISYCLAKFNKVKNKTLVFKFLNKCEGIIFSKFATDSNFFAELKIIFQNYKQKILAIYSNEEKEIYNKTKNLKIIKKNFSQQNENHENKETQKKIFDMVKEDKNNSFQIKKISKSQLKKIKKNEKIVRSFDDENFSVYFENKEGKKKESTNHKEISKSILNSFLKEIKEFTEIKNDLQVEKKEQNHLKSKVSIEKEIQKSISIKKSKRLMIKILEELEVAKIERNRIMKQQEKIIKNLKTRQDFSLSNKNNNNKYSIHKNKKSNIIKEIINNCKDIGKQLFLMIFIEEINKEKSSAIKIPIKNGRVLDVIFYLKKSKNADKFWLKIMKKDTNDSYIVVSILSMEKLYLFLNTINLEGLANPLITLTEINTLHLFITKFFIFFIRFELNTIKNNDLQQKINFQSHPNFPMGLDFQSNNSFLSENETLIANKVYRINHIHPFDYTIILQVFLIKDFDNFLLHKEGMEHSNIYNNIEDSGEMDFLINFDIIKINNMKCIFMEIYKTKIKIVSQKFKFNPIKNKHYVYFVQIKKNSFVFLLYYFESSKKEFFCYYELIKKDIFIKSKESFFYRLNSEVFFNYFGLNQKNVRIANYPFILNLLTNIIVEKTIKKLLKHNLKNILSENILVHNSKFEIQKKKFIDFQIFYCKHFLFLIFEMSFFEEKFEKKIVFYQKKSNNQSISEFKENLFQTDFLKNFFEKIYFFKDGSWFTKRLLFFNDDKIHFYSF